MTLAPMMHPATRHGPLAGLEAAASRTCQRAVFAAVLQVQPVLIKVDSLARLHAALEQAERLRGRLSQAALNHLWWERGRGRPRGRPRLLLDVVVRSATATPCHPRRPARPACTGGGSPLEPFTRPRG